MADIRELLILNSRFVSSHEGTLVRIIANVRMALRRFVLVSARLPVLRALYLQVYRLHVWVARTLVRSFAGTRSMYLSAGIGRGEIRPGISDIDMVILGDWPEDSQIRLLKALAVTVLVFPLFDRESLGSIQTWPEFLKVNQTDLLLAYHYASAKRNWKLEFGEDLIQQLPDLSSKRRAGAAYLDVRRWWTVAANMAFGRGVTSRDTVFRNSLCYKAIADILRAELVAHNVLPARSRNLLLRENLAGPDLALRDRLLASEASSFLSMTGDMRQDAIHWVLERIEHLHATLPAEPSFAPCATPCCNGSAADRLIAAETAAHIERMVESAAALPGFRSAHLTHGADFICPDTLGLFLHFEPAHTPSVETLRAFIAPHLDVVKQLPQRVGVYLLLKRGAFILDPVFGLEFWSAILMPQANPDIFAALADPAFCLRGSPRPPVKVCWSHVSQEILVEELMVRRGAMQRFGVSSRPKPIDNLRNLWRLLQLVTMERRSTAGEILIPTSIPATSRALAASAPELAGDLEHMLSATRKALNGEPVDIAQAMQRVYDWTTSPGLQRESAPAAAEPALTGSRNS